MSEEGKHIDQLRKDSENFALPVNEEVWSAIESEISSGNTFAGWFKKRYLLLLIPILGAVGYFYLPENPGYDSMAVTVAPQAEQPVEDKALSPEVSLEENKTDLTQETSSTSPSQDIVSNRKEVESSQENVVSPVAKKQDLSAKKKKDKNPILTVAPTIDESPKSAQTQPESKKIEKNIKSTSPEKPIADKPKESIAELSVSKEGGNEDAAVEPSNEQEVQTPDPITNAVKAPEVEDNGTKQVKDIQETAVAQSVPDNDAENIENREVKTEKTPSSEPNNEKVNATLESAPATVSSEATLKKTEDNLRDPQDKKRFLDAISVMPFYGYGISNRRLSSKDLSELVKHKDDHESASTSNRFGLRLNYNLKNESFFAVGMEYASYGEHYNFQHDIVTHETDNKYQYLQVSLSYGQHVWGKGKHDLFLLLGAKWSLLDQAQSSWVDTEQLAVVSHNNRGLGQPFRNNTYVFFGGLEYTYQLSNRFKIHAFPVYDRFLNSVYNADTDLDQKQFSASMNIGLSFGL